MPHSALVSLILLALACAQPIDECPSQCQCTDKEINCRSAQLTNVPQLMRTSIEVLDMKDNSLRVVARDSLDIYATVQILDMSSNDIERIDEQAFQSNSALMKLNLAENSLDRLYEESFNGLESLVSLNLTMNRLVEVFRALRMEKLRELYLGYNQLDEVPANTLQGVYNLRILDLRNNQISKIHPKAFEALAHLRFLILKNNPLRSAASNLDLSNNAWLHVLDLTNCKIEQELSNLPRRLRDIRLSFNNMTNITSMFKGAMYVDMIILNDNNLLYIDQAALSGLPYLRELWLNRNQLERIPKLPEYLRAIHVDDNRIQSIDHNSFRVTPLVEIISLQNNQIKRLPSESFRNLRLRMIDVSMNEIAVLQRYTFSNLPVLYSVDLSRNPIQRLDIHSFDNVTNLHWLQLARTKVDMVEVESLEMLTMMKKLQYLDLTSSPGVAHKLIDSGVVLTEVRNLNLMFNDLETLPETFPSQIPNIRRLHLSGNRWHCNASLSWLPDFILENEKLFFAKNHIVCDTPLKWRGRAIHTLTIDEMKAVTGGPVIDVEPCPECKEPCDDTAATAGPEIIEDGGGVDEGSEFGPEPFELRQSDEASTKVVRFRGKILMTTPSPSVDVVADGNMESEAGDDGVRIHAVANVVEPQLEAENHRLPGNGSSVADENTDKVAEFQAETDVDTETVNGVAEQNAGTNPGIKEDATRKKKNEAPEDSETETFSTSVKKSEETSLVKAASPDVEKKMIVDTFESRVVEDSDASVEGNTPGKLNEVVSEAVSTSVPDHGHLEEERDQNPSVASTAMPSLAPDDEAVMEKVMVDEDSRMRSTEEPDDVALNQPEDESSSVHGESNVQASTVAPVENGNAVSASHSTQGPSEEITPTEQAAPQKSVLAEGPDNPMKVSEAVGTEEPTHEPTEFVTEAAVTTTEDNVVKDQLEKDDEVWRLMERMFKF